MNMNVYVPAFCSSQINSEATSTRRRPAGGPHGWRGNPAPHSSNVDYRGALRMVSQRIQHQFSEPSRGEASMASRDRRAHQFGRCDGCAKRPARPSSVRMAGIRLQKIRRRLPRRTRDPARGKSGGKMRDLSLQFRRHSRLGIFSDQHRASQAAGTQSARPAGLQGKYRLRLPAL